MATQKFTITHCPTYNKVLKQRGSLTVWMDESSIASWTEKTSPERRGRPLHYSDMAITDLFNKAPETLKRNRKKLSIA